MELLNPVVGFTKLPSTNRRLSSRNTTGSSLLPLKCNELKATSRSTINCHRITDPGRRSRSSVLGTLNKRFTVCCSKSEQDTKLNSSGKNIPARNIHKDGTEPFHGKSGSVSFHGLTHQQVEESKLESAPFNENSGSVIWVLAPVALISSLLLPQFFISTTIVSDEILSEILVSFTCEVMFYIGLSIFLTVTDHVQRPYLQFSSKRWGLITGLKGYLSSAYLIMGLKVTAPLLAVYVTWPILGLPAVVSVAPYFAGLLVQLLFELRVDKCGSSSWPLVPVIFEVYRLYQLSKAANFLERLMYAMKGVPMTPQIMEKSGAMLAMLVTFQVIGVLCLWSLITFLLRLFPSRPVAQNY